MRRETRIKIFRAEHQFASAHFLVGMGKCERLHGHNYSITVQIGGSAGSNGVIIDFNVINPVIGKIAESLDHKTLIAGDMKSGQLNIGDNEVEIVFGEKRFVLPKPECVILPIETTTVESMAGYICDRLTEFVAQDFPNVDWIEAGVREGAAQMAIVKRWLK